MGLSGHKSENGITVLCSQYDHKDEMRSCGTNVA